MKHLLTYSLTHLFTAILIMVLLLIAFGSIPFGKTFARSEYPPPNSILSQSETKNNEIEDLVTVEISIDVTVEGAENGDAIELQLLSDTQETTTRLESLGIVLPKWSFQNGSRTITVAALPIGTYKLLIEVPQIYFRQPQGYLFMVAPEGITTYSNAVFHFELIPPSAQDFPPCSGSVSNLAVSSDEPLTDTPFVEPNIVCKAEAIIDLSSPPKQPEQQSKGNSSDGYHYVGPQTFDNNQGVWGRNYVVDPEVQHSIGLDQFVVERVYANDVTINKWMEAGWVERRYRDDRQYVYEFDSATTWHYFDQFSLSVGSPVETQVYYSQVVGKWRAIYYIGDDSWALLAEEALDFIVADNGYNRGEVLTYGVHPLLPLSYFDKSYLLVSGAWRVWDTQYSTLIAEDDPYHCDTITEYTRFFIHSSLVFPTFLPITLNIQ